MIRFGYEQKPQTPNADNPKDRRPGTDCSDRFHVTKLGNNMSNLYRVKLVFVLCLILMSDLLAQDNMQASEVPTNLMSVLVVPDAKCPLQATSPKALGFSNGSFEFGYTLENKSKSSVEFISIQGWNWLGSSGFETVIDLYGKKPFRGGTSRSPIWLENSLGLVPFDQNKALQTIVSQTKNKLWIVMIVKVKLSDGTVYDASEKYEQLNNYIKSRSKAKKDDLHQWENDLRQFISKLMTEQK